MRNLPNCKKATKEKSIRLIVASIAFIMIVSTVVSMNVFVRAEAADADTVSADAAENVASEDPAVLAEDITKTCEINSSGFKNARHLTDRSIEKYASSSSDGATVTIKSDVLIGSLYIVFGKKAGEWTLSAGNIQKTCGEYGFLHEFVDVVELTGEHHTEITLSFPGGHTIAEITVFSGGKVPDNVEQWEPPCEKADLLLLIAHSDDEHLFFAGILPYYAGELGYAVQVVYLSDHSYEYIRPHEMLEGLWVAGVRNYPVSGNFPDIYSESLTEARSKYSAKGYSVDSFVEFIVKMLRRFRPKVVVSHDLNGEYSHGTHILTAYALTEAVAVSSDAEKYPESADEYGVWDVPKTYLHLYGEGKITMIWDEPLDAFGGKTAFTVSQEAFMCHKSQHWTWFYRWMYGSINNKITLASEIKKYSPMYFGLYRTTVGLDQNTEDGDFFENIKTYGEEKAEEEAAAKEALKRLESERAEREAAESESRRLESEKAAAESESRRLESEKAAESELHLLESEFAEQTEEEDAPDKQYMIIAITIPVAVAIMCGAVVINAGAQNKKNEATKDIDNKR
jgi:LmbE family N-acetylglucosaminyl deacetylase